MSVLVFEKLVRIDNVYCLSESLYSLSGMLISFYFFFKYINFFTYLALQTKNMQFFSENKHDNIPLSMTYTTIQKKNIMKKVKYLYIYYPIHIFFIEGKFFHQHKILNYQYY